MQTMNRKKGMFMTTFYFIRHGEPDFSEAGTGIYQGFCVHMLTLTEKGKQQIRDASKDERLKKAELILASPYGRAMHTAAILSKELNLDIQVETDLHEWVADAVNYSYLPYEEAVRCYQELHENQGHHPEGKECIWESVENMQTRVLEVLKKYQNYEHVIVSCHGTLMQYVLGMEHPEHGQIAEYKL